VVCRPGLVAAHASVSVYLRELCKTREIVEGEKVKLQRGGERRRKGEAAQERKLLCNPKAGR
jgi:hypothetical protein